MHILLWLKRAETVNCVCEKLESLWLVGNWSRRREQEWRELKMDPEERILRALECLSGNAETMQRSDIE